ncbi:MAG: hypothetical protein ACI970_000220 [Myxococcota bacterium]|jgi:hypothetical protein
MARCEPLMALVPIPVRASVRDLLRDLVGAKVTVTEDKQQELDAARSSYLAVYRQDDGTAVASVITDLTTAAALGGALGMMSAADVSEAMGEASSLEGDLYDSFGEVVNVFSKLLNSPTTRHVTLDGLLPVPGEVPASVADVVLTPRARVDYTIAVEGHATGILTLLSH